MILRRVRSGLLIDFSAHQVSVARLARLEENPIRIESAAELPAGNTPALETWLHETFDDQKGLIPAVCSFRPLSAILRRNASVNPKRLGEADYLAGLVNEHARRDSLSDWKLAALNPKDGAPLDPVGAPRHALLVGIDHAEVRRIQKTLLDVGVLPRRLELSTVPMLGGVMHCAANQGVTDAVVVCEIEAGHSSVYILGKDGVHTPEPLHNGLDSIIEAAQREFALDSAEAARTRLETVDDDLIERSRRLARPLARLIKPAVDYYELQTGQRVGSVFCPNLPTKLAWIAEALAASDRLALFQPDCTAWCEKVGLSIPTDGSISLGPRWLGPLSQVARLTLAPAS
jgi:hypothetical protein